MTTAQGTDINSSANALTARLRPADDHPLRAVSQMAGPFEAAAEDRGGPTMRDALMTGLLVIYPALATVAAIVAGLFLAGASGA